LEVAGLTAAPAVLGIEDDGYVREVAPPLAPRTGRRASRTGTPATAERAALGRARDDLDALVDALHERSWLLGARPGGGLGIRRDGSVILLDLDGLRPGEGLAERRADRRWVDSVLHDEQRTLRRRVHHAAPRTTGTPSAHLVPAAPSASARPRGSGDSDLPDCAEDDRPTDGEQAPRGGQAV